MDKKYTDSIINELKKPNIMPVQIAKIYRRAILEKPCSEEWLIVNNAIVDKWDFSTLEVIKHIAWKHKKNNILNRISKLMEE